jgi:hypothetical protein
MSSSTPTAQLVSLTTGHETATTTAQQSSVANKRGKYKARDKPNWNKELLDKERAAKKKANNVPTKSRSRSKKVKEVPRPPLTALPVEVLDLIVTYILPTTHSLADRFPHPAETPYPCHLTNLTSNLKARAQRWGAIPQNIVDILNFGKCCRQTMHAVDRVIGGLGGSRPALTMEDNKNISMSTIAAPVAHGLKR